MKQININELKQMKIWVVWRYETRNGRKTKVPYSVKGLPTGTSKKHSSEWATYDEVAKITGFDGVGFVLPDGMFMFDADDIDSENPDVQKILALLNSYTERSASGQGIHVYGQYDIASLPSSSDEFKRNWYFNRRPYEIYPGHLTNRFAAFTGDVIKDLPIMDCTENLLSVLNDWFSRQIAAPTAAGSSPFDTEESEPDDFDILAAIKKHPKYGPLFRGDISGYPSHSEADQGLCDYLAFMGCSAKQIDRLFRQSGLIRDKWWKREDYRESTILNALLIVESKLFSTETAAVFRMLDRDKKGKALSTANNFQKVIENDPHFKLVRYNELANAIYSGDRLFDDTDSAKEQLYIEKMYSIWSPQKFETALRAVADDRKFHPVQDYMNSLKWDGAKRVGTLFITFLGARDCAYTREVERLLFAGIVRRVFEPGCKFESVCVLKGKQGSGKSTIIQWLAIKSIWFASVKTMSGQKGIEAVQGIIVGELEELLATIANEKTGTHAEEIAKAYISSQWDHYRAPYDRRVTNTARTCALVGSTNQGQFLGDPTGARRWYPVEIDCDAAQLYEREQEIRTFIDLCYAEMLNAYQSGDSFAQPFPKTELLEEIQTHQADSEVENPRYGMIDAYLSGRSMYEDFDDEDDEDFTVGGEPEPRERVCLLELWRAALGERGKLERKDSVDIANYLTQKLGWERGNAEWFSGYGKQKAYRRQNIKMTTKA